MVLNVYKSHIIELFIPIYVYGTMVELYKSIDSHLQFMYPSILSDQFSQTPTSIFTLTRRFIFTINLCT